jgi:hypothetical protein
MKLGNAAEMLKILWIKLIFFDSCNLFEFKWISLGFKGISVGFK